MQSQAIACLLSFFVCGLTAKGEGFLKHDPRASRYGGDRDADFQHAMASVMGCGTTGPRQRDLSAVKAALAPIWRALPKNNHERVEWRMLRYAAHRYFLQQSSLLIRGFEPARQVNDSHVGDAEILNKHVPSLVETVLEGKRSSTGFTLDDAAALVATLEQVILDSERSIIESVYEQKRRSPQERLTHDELHGVIEDYMVHWLIGGDPETLALVKNDRSVIGQILPHWEDMRHFANGVIKSVEFARQSKPRSGHGSVAMTQMYSFEDAHEAVGSITRTFASYWETECQAIKTSLVAMDRTGTGRVSLTDFYGSNADGEWRFGESEEYLRELGALDGKHVIIPNYLQGASNCIVSTPNYFVCCVNECEAILNDVEDSVGEPVAKPDDILRALANSTTFDDDAPKLAGALTTQLQRIADIHGGSVPLHGRLFAQWLHYVFPRECPFPHRAGLHSSVSVAEFGQKSLATDTEINHHAASRDDNAILQAQMAEQDEAQWMSQWSEEEELIADYSRQLRAPWERRLLPWAGLVGGVILLLMFKVGVLSIEGVKEAGGSSTHASKAHFV